MKINSSKQYELLTVALPLIIGAVAFFLVVGPRVLNPTNLSWLGEGDTTTHYLGWLFFRHAEWSFPFGLNPNYGLELGNSIVFSDSNPLLAFLFKPFSPWLPETFQYFGIWLLACFLLQAWFARKLVGLISDSVVISVLGAGFFVFAPPMIWRLHGHLSLVGHFLIVAALYLALNQGLHRRKWAWGTLLAVTALVHAYLLAMVMLIWLADITDKTIKSKLPMRKAIIEFAIIVSVIAIVCWQAGYFSVGDGLITSGYGFFRMNLLSMFDPSGWSYILKDIPEAQGDYDGFNFLGLGVIFIGVCTLPAVFSCRTRVSGAIGKYLILGVLLLALAIFAVSNNVGFGLQGFKYPMPYKALKVANIFRSSGRMFWPVFYTILFAAIFLVVRGYEKRTAVLLLGLGLFLQIADTHSGWTGIRKKLMTEPKSAWNTKLADPFWEEAASRYTKVRWIQPGNHTPYWLTLATYAGTHGLATDAVYLARRVSTSAMEKAQVKASEALQTGRYEADSLYFLDDSVIRQAALNVNADTDVLARIDGFAVLAPGWKKCTNCPHLKDEVQQTDLFSSLPAVKVGERMLLSQSGSGLPYLFGGWSQAEVWGLWSDGPKAIVVLPLSEKRATSILIEAHPLVSPTHPKQDVEVLINGIPATKIILTADSKRMFEVKIPKKAFETGFGNNILKLEFHFPDAARPKDIGINDDTRKLALGIISITVL